MSNPNPRVNFLQPRMLAVLLALAVFLFRAAAAPTTHPASDDLERMVRDGMVEALEARLVAPQSPADHELLARAYAARAQRTTAGDERRSAYILASQKYDAWIASLAAQAKSNKPADVVHLAAGRSHYVQMLLSGPIASELADFELTDGRRCDRLSLTKSLQAARTQAEQAATELAPLIAELPAHEEELLSAGVFDTLQQVRSNLTLALAWTTYYLGVLECDDAAQRTPWLTGAERKFHDSLDAAPTKDLRAQSALGLALTQREQGRFADAIENFRAALGEDISPALVAQARYELARAQLGARLFDEARTTLKPLAELDPQNLPPEQAPALLYVNLAHLWDANSYLLEAAQLRPQVGPGTTAQATLLQKIERCRTEGLARMRRLSDLGPPWPALVQLYINAAIDPKAPPEQLEALELLYTATALLEAKRPADALLRLQAATTRPAVDTRLAGDLQFEIGRCQYQLRDERAAAQTFQTLAAEQRRHPRAAEAATLAYQLWGQIAEHSQAAADYLHLADALRNLIRSYADHPQRDAALWLLPIALTHAGQYEEAIARFDQIAANSPHWEEAQFRRALCRCQMVEAQRGTLAADELKDHLRKAADGLVRYAAEAQKRAAQATPPTPTRWEIEARVSAGEIFLAPELLDPASAQQAVETIDVPAAPGDLQGRVLAVRIRACAGLSEFDRAAQMLSEYLKSAAPEQAGPTLATLAQAMRAEVEHLQSQDQPDAARHLATESVKIFAELEKWVRADASRTAHLEFVLFGRAQMHYLAGQYADAQRLVNPLLEKSPKNGGYQLLRALVMSAALPAGALTERLNAAREAWAALLADPGLRRTAPERYWEARYNWLALTLKLGQRSDVVQAITQERVWYPDLGGPPWREKLEALLAEATPADAQNPRTP